MEESKKGNRIRLMVSGKELEIDELGVLSPTQKQVEELHAEATSSGD